MWWKGVIFKKSVRTIFTLFPNFISVVEPVVESKGAILEDST